MIEASVVVVVVLVVVVGTADGHYHHELEKNKQRELVITRIQTIMIIKIDICIYRSLT